MVCSVSCERDGVQISDGDKNEPLAVHAYLTIKYSCCVLDRNYFVSIFTCQGIKHSNFCLRPTAKLSAEGLESTF
jgi:hypothetical protein